MLILSTRTAQSELLFLFFIPFSLSIFHIFTLQVLCSEFCIHLFVFLLEILLLSFQLRYVWEIFLDRDNDYSFFSVSFFLIEEDICQERLPLWSHLNVKLSILNFDLRTFNLQFIKVLIFTKFGFFNTHLSLVVNQNLGNSVHVMQKDMVFLGWIKQVVKYDSFLHCVELVLHPTELIDEVDLSLFLGLYVWHFFCYLIFIFVRNIISLI